MARVAEDEVERLKAEVSLVSLAEAAGVELRKTGADLTGCCPFHEDKTPSSALKSHYARRDRICDADEGRPGNLPRRLAGNPGGVPRSGHGRVRLAAAAVGENVLVSVMLEILAAVVLEKAGVVVANDSARSSFTVAAGDCLLALDGGLKEAGRWPLQPRPPGWHSTRPSRGLALICGPDEVRLADQAGRILWRYQHAPWAGQFESGCTWFDETGQPHAVVPAPSYDGCLVVRLDLESGRPLAQVPIDAAPAGISPVHQPDGWVGLSEGEGQDAVKAWWVRSAGQPPVQARIQVLDAGWDDQVLSDVDPSGTKIITTPHNSGPLNVRTFPGLDVLRSIDPPAEDSYWDFTACFAGDLLIAKLTGPRERLVAIAGDGTIHDLGHDDQSWLIPAAHGTWLAATRTTIRRCRVLVTLITPSPSPSPSVTAASIDHGDKQRLASDNYRWASRYQHAVVVPGTFLTPRPSPTCMRQAAQPLETSQPTKQLSASGSLNIAWTGNPEFNEPGGRSNLRTRHSELFIAGVALTPSWCEVSRVQCITSYPIP